MLDIEIKIDPNTNKQYFETSLYGDALLNCSQLNKGTAFDNEEREQFNLIGKLPYKVETLDEQTIRAFKQYQNQNTNEQKNFYLHTLHAENQTLFYKLVQDHVDEILPIIYTPHVAQTIKNFSQSFLRPNGLYISYEQTKDQIESILQNHASKKIEIIVVTDGERILGIGDQGIGGIEIPIAKLMLYTLFGGINPLKTLPIVLDVGTNNKALLNDQNYLGWKHERITGHDYYDFIERFVHSVKKIFPKVFFHWEDFGRDNAQSNLEKYQNKICSFNDDIQGTSVVTLAAILTALKRTEQNLRDQRIVIFGAGSAGIGIAESICFALTKAGVSLDNAKKNFWLIDRQGLLIENTNGIIPSQKPYLRSLKEINSWNVENKNKISLLDVIENVKPTILIGCAGVGGAFDEKAIRTLVKYIQNPIILPLSNPTEKSEADPKELIKWTNNNAFIATGSPFSGVSQCNNALSFPGIGLAAVITKAKKVTKSMLWSATLALHNYSLQNLPRNDKSLLPPMKNAGEVAIEIAIAVAEQIRAEKLTELNANIDLKELITNHQWQPKYLKYKRNYLNQS